MFPQQVKEHRIILASDLKTTELDRLIESNKDLKNRVLELTASLQQEVNRRQCVENNYESVMAKLDIVEQEAQYYSLLLGQINHLFTACYPALDGIRAQLDLQPIEPCSGMTQS